MAAYYVYSAAGGAGTGADWANAFTTLAAAFAAGAAGDTYYVADDHAETAGSAKTLSPKGTTAAPDRIMCVRRSGGSVPPVTADLRTTASITTTGAFDLTLSGVDGGLAYWYGINLYAGGSGGSGALRTSNAPTHIMWECSFNQAGASGNIVLGAGNPQLLLNNHDFGFTATGSILYNAGNGCVMQVNGGSLIGSAVPDTFVNTTGTSNWEFNGFNTAAKTSGALVAAITTDGNGTVRFNNCKLGGAVTFGTPTKYGWTVDINNVDSADTNYRSERYTYAGTQTMETTIVRSGGASDGTTPISWKVVTTANAKQYAPFVCKPIVSQWNTSVGSSMTATVEIAGSAALKDSEIWAEVQYLGTSGFPLSSFANDGVDVLPSTTGTNQTSSSATWATSPASTQKLVVTFTPQEAGVAIITVYVGKASATVYIDPKVTLA